MEGREKLWNELRALEGESVAERTGARFQDGAYFVNFLSRELRVDPAARSIETTGLDTQGSLFESNHLGLAVLSYLLSGEIRRPEGIWITEKELPGGSLFFQGPHGMPVGSIIEKFGRSAKGLVSRGIALGGVKSQFGDGSVELRVLPGVRMCIVLWEEDEEFPASCTIMFDKSFRYMLALDVVLGLTHAVVDTIVCE